MNKKEPNTYNVCLNCEKYGHHHHQCKIPILSVGILAFTLENDEPKFLMVRRRHTLGFMDFMRGKYSIYNKEYLLNLFVQMTMEEKDYILTKDFAELWSFLWNKQCVSEQYSSEKQISKEKYETLKFGIMNTTHSYSLESLVQESNELVQWTEAEWGFPKGRKNYNEKDLDGAFREFTEETGYLAKHLKIVENILPFEEIFMGSNYKTYKHRYFLMNLMPSSTQTKYDTTEIGKVEWKTYKEAMECIRPYNLEKLRLLKNIHMCFQHMTVANH